jgi:ketose-bisphosphate aldolase
MKQPTTPFVPMSDLLLAARRGGYAVPGFCIWNAETIAAVLATAQEEQAPVILMCGPGEFPLLPPRALADLARRAVAEVDVPVAFHLDHGDILARCRECLDAGFSSVMIDASHHPFADNVALTRQVVEWARPLGVTVEGEIGALGRVDDATTEGSGTATLTDPDEAARFVGETGVDALAVSIGNAHGIYPGRPQLDFERLAQIADRVDVPLVLHGGSGTPEADLQRAIRAGMCKVNVASELARAFRETLLHAWLDSARPTWPPLAEVEAMAEIQNVVRRWLRRTGAAGRS